MGKLWPLLWVQLRGLFSLGRLLRTPGKRGRLKLAGFGLLVLGVGALMAFASYQMCGVMAQIGLAELLPVLLVATCAVMSLLATVLKAGGLLFGHRDYDLIMSLPVRASTVIASRLLTLYLFTLALDAVIFLPGTLVYTRAVPGAGWGMPLLGLLLGPLLPIAVGAAVSLVLTLLLARLPFKNLLLALASFGMFFGVMWLSFWIQTRLPRALMVVDLEPVMRGFLYQIYPPVRLFAEAIGGAGWGPMALFAALSLGVAVVFVAFFALGFRRINTLVSTRRRGRGYIHRQQRAGSALSALYRKELRRFFGNAVYMLNTAVGAVLLLALGLLSFAWRGSTYETVLAVFDAEILLVRMIPLAAAFLLAVSSTTSCSLSLEARTRWILYSAPVPAHLIFDAKILVNLTINLSAALIAGVLLSVNFRMTPAETAMTLLVPAVWGTFAAVFGMWINDRLPQFDWTNEYAVIKRSMSVFIAVFGGMLLAIANIVAALLLDRVVELTLLGAAVIAALTVMFYLLLRRRRLYL